MVVTISSSRPVTRFVQSVKWPHLTKLSDLVQGTVRIFIGNTKSVRSELSLTTATGGDQSGI